MTVSDRALGIVALSCLAATEMLLAAQAVAPAAAAGTTAASSDWPRAPVVQRPPLKENFSPRAVSAPQPTTDRPEDDAKPWLIYGLMAGRPEGPVPWPTDTARMPELYVSGLPPSVRRLCVDIERAQGGYQASFEMALQTTAPELVVAFDSEPSQRATLARMDMRNGELAVRVRGTDTGCADGTAGRLMPAAWGRFDASAPLYLAVGGGSSEGVPEVRVNQYPAVPCNTVQASLQRQYMGSQVYGYLCSLDDALQACQADNEVTVFWRQGGQPHSYTRLRFSRRCRVGG